jgi:MarR family transcriptional repressor of emrRAB
MHAFELQHRQGNILGAAALAVTDRMLGELAGSAGLNATTAAALVHLRLRPGENIDFLARVTGLSHPAAVRVVDRLVADGLVKRRPARDRRARALVLTRAGQRLALRVLAEREQALADALAPLSSRECQALTQLLGKLLAGLTDSRWSSRHICRLCDYPTCARPQCPVDQAACRIEAHAV